MFKSSGMAKNLPASEMASPNQINAGTRIEGNIVSDGNIRLDGDLRGKIESKGKVVIGSTSHVQGDIFCANADIMGKVTGNIYVSDKTALKASCELNGNIQTGSLSIEPGAKFNGKCQMGAKQPEVKQAILPELESATAG
jgi:cytoskeletal protein CcmA (bactofilin family)